MKKYSLLTAMVFPLFFMAQVGVNTTIPKATLDITAKNTNGTTPEGVIAPRLTGYELKVGNLMYTSAQTGSIVYVTAAVGTASAYKS